jgi:sugar-specific transcriptional regulator TrmB
VTQLTKLAATSIKELEADSVSLENPEKAAVIESPEEVLNKFRTILSYARKSTLCVVDRMPSGKYVPTKAAIGLMNRQIEHLKDLKDLIKAKDGNNKTSK